MPSGPGVIEDTRAAEIAAIVPSEIETFLLTCLTNVHDIAGQHRRCGTTAVQICDEPDGCAGGGNTAAVYAELRRTMRAGTKVVQVIHVADGRAVEQAKQLAPHVDAILLDSGNPNLTVKELGGTGRRHDWEISRRIREAIAPLPVWLAGGLAPENVRQAIEEVEPFGLDVCSGVRTNDQLDRRKLERFFDACRG